MFKKYSLITLLIALMLVISPLYAEIVPVNKSQMTKDISTDTNCTGDICSQEGLVNYHRDGMYMMVNSLEQINNNGNVFSKITLKNLNSFLEGLGEIQKPELGTLFNYCIDYICFPLGEIANVTYPGMDSCRAIYIIDTDEELIGNIGVQVFAKKGDQYVMLSRSTYLKTHDDNDLPNPLYKQCLREFGIKETVSNYAPFVECYQKKLQDNAETQEILKQQATEMIDFFAIK